MVSGGGASCRIAVMLLELPTCRSLGLDVGALLPRLGVDPAEHGLDLLAGAQLVHLVLTLQGREREKRAAGGGRGGEQGRARHQWCT